MDTSRTLLRRYHINRVSFSLLLAISLTGCAIDNVKYEPVSKNVRAAENNFQKKISVGDFSRNESSSLVDDPWTFRGATKYKSPVGSGHHDYIAKALSDELMLARRLDDESDKELTGRLTEHRIETMGQGKGAVEMAFELKEDGKTIYEKSHRVDSSWDFAFMGMTAANKAMRAYLTMIEQLVFNLFSDEEFSEAVNQ